MISVSPAEARRAFENLLEGASFDKHWYDSNVATVRAFLDQQSVPLSGEPGKVLHEGWASVGRDGRFSSVYWFDDDLPEAYRVAKYPGERIVRLQLVEIPPPSSQTPALPPQENPE